MSALAWFLHQTGEPGWREAIDYVDRVIDLGYPTAAGYVVGNMIGDPNLRPRAVDLLRRAMAKGYQVDPVGWAMNVAQQGDAPNAASLMSLRMYPYPFSSEEQFSLVQQATESVARIHVAEQQASDARDTIATNAAEVNSESVTAKERIQTKTGALFALIQAATNRQAESVFNDEAETLGAEEKVLWRSGIGVVSVAAVVALMGLLHDRVTVVSHAA